MRLQDMPPITQVVPIIGITMDILIGAGAIHGLVLGSMEATAEASTEVMASTEDVASREAASMGAEAIASPVITKSLAVAAVGLPREAEGAPRRELRSEQRRVTSPNQEK